MFKTPEKEKKVWGQRTRIYSDGKTEVYLLEVTPVDGKPVVCSIHHHNMKYNRFFVVEGSVGVEHGGNHKKEDPMWSPSKWLLKAGEEYTVKPGDVHRFVVVQPAKIIETTWADAITEDIIRQDEGHVIDTWGKDAG